MTFFGSSVRVEQVDSPDALEFRITPILQGYHLLLMGAVAAVLVGATIHIWVGALAGVGAVVVYYLVKENDHRPRVLRVTETILEAHGRQDPEKLLWST